MHLLERPWHLKMNTHQATVSDEKSFLERLLLSRDCLDREACEEFMRLSKEEDFYHDPMSLKSMPQLAKRLSEAIAAREQILVFGDYDLDGISATALIVNYFRAQGLDILYYLPNRLEDGYGISDAGIEYAIAKRPDLVLTVDCGITANVAIDALKQEGFPVYVTDHHRPGDDLPEAICIVNPMQHDCPYKNKSLAGVGVAFKLIQAIELLRHPDEAPRLVMERVGREYSQYVMLGTIADMMTMSRENSSLIRLAFSELKMGRGNPGLLELIYQLKISSEEICSSKISFGIAPCFNAAGRIGDPCDALHLLIDSDPEACRRNAARLIEMNEVRKELERDFVKRARLCIEENPEIMKHSALCLEIPNCHKGVLGIMAARISARYSCPALIFTQEDESELGDALLRGSARSHGELKLYDAVSCAERYVESFGGHQQALGVELRRSQIEDFREIVSEEIYKNYPFMSESERFALDYDLDAKIADISLENAEALQIFEPTGRGRRAFLFRIQNLFVERMYPVGLKKNHLIIHVRSRGGKPITATAFGKAKYMPFINKGASIDILGQLEVNRYMGRESLRIMVQDIHIHAKPIEKRGRLELHQKVTALYRCISHAYEPGGVFINLEDFCRVFWPLLDPPIEDLDLKPSDIRSYLQVLAEIDILDLIKISELLYFVVLRQNPERRQLSDSKIYQELMKGAVQDGAS